MKTPKDFLSEIKSNKKSGNDESEKMDFLMKAIRAVRSQTITQTDISQEELEKLRTVSEKRSKLVTAGTLTDTELFTVGDIPCMRVNPKFAHRKDVVIMYCHGGGFANGGLNYAGILAEKLARNTGIPVVTFQYRLAPENPYPAAIEDTAAIWDYLMNLGYGAKKVILAGDSAGGNLSLELMLKLKAEGRFLPKAGILMSPWTDMTLSSNSYNTYADKDPMLTRDYINIARVTYAGEDADFADPKYSPLFANLDNMPPMLVQLGSNEILRDDAEKLVKKLRRSGSMAKLEVYQGCWHVFQQFPIPKATAALTSVKEFLDLIL